MIDLDFFLLFLKFTRKKNMKIVYVRKKSFTFSFDHDLEKKKKGAQSARKSSIDSKGGADTRESALFLSQKRRFRIRQTAERSISRHSTAIIK